MSRRVLRPSATLVALGLLVSTGESAAAPVFLLDKTETTIFDVIPSWTQASACDCCVCWETALGTIFSYWDDVYYPSAGPWESLLLYGNRTDAAAFKTTTGTLWQISGLGCNEGAQYIQFWSYQARDVAQAYTESLGYSFSYDVDEWVWFGDDVADEIDADRPIYYSYYPEGDSAHAVTLVGYDADDETLYLYKNWEPVLTLKGFDEASDHRTINITPGGSATVPAEWICSDEFYENNESCDCACGAYDPDCDSDGVALNCEPDQSCNTDGECVGCDDECDPPAGDRCDSNGDVVSCSDTDADGCLELGSPEPCSAGSVCQDGDCIECTCDQPNAIECTDGTHYRVCNALTTDCARWSLGVACPDDQLCVDDQCQPSGAGGQGGSGAANVGGGAPEGGSGGAPLVPTSKVERKEESGCCSVAPGRADRSPGRALLLLVGMAAALGRRRRAGDGSARR